MASIFASKAGQTSNNQQPVCPPNHRRRETLYVQTEEPGPESSTESPKAALSILERCCGYIQFPPQVQSHGRSARSASTRHGKPFLSLAAVRSGLQGRGDWAPGSRWSRAAVVCHVCLDKMSCGKGAAEAELTCEYTGRDNPR